MNFEEYLQKVGQWAIGTGLRILIIVVLTLVAVKLAQSFVQRLFDNYQEKRNADEELKKRIDTLSGIVTALIVAVIFAVSIAIILGQLNIELGPILAAAGVVGVAVGFGAQHLVSDVISGFFLLFDDQLRVGDVVQIAGKGGLVERVNIRMVVLRDLAGNVHYIRNGQIDVVTNMTKEYSRYVFDVGVAYREDVDEVISVIKQVDEDMRTNSEFTDDILEPIEILGLDQFADSAVIIKARTKTKPIRQWAVGREFNRRLKKAFDDRNIEIPFPHMTLYMGQEKDGSAPPVQVSMLASKQ
ncbi:MAG: mechanosensitive ion channel family protein [Sedimentisphaeraceae bacterium JB056]